MTSEQERRWHYFENGVFPVKVFLFFGTRKDMIDTSVAGMRSCFERADALPEAELFYEKMRSSFRRDVVGIDGECLSVEIDSGKRVFFVRIDDFDGSVEDTATLSHECLHAALFVLDHCGISEHSPYETLCYLHEAIFHEFMLHAFGRIGMLKNMPEKTERGKQNEQRNSEMGSD